MGGEHCQISEEKLNRNDEINGDHDTRDMRHTLTQWERDSVARLKDACDSQGIEYRHLFELAKYVLVVKSMYDDKDPEVDEKRLEAALKRLKKRRKWEQKHGQNAIKDKFAALREFEAAAPEYHHPKFMRDNDGRRCTTIHVAFPPIDYINKSEENMQKFLFIEQWGLDIAAYDMVEARKGITLVSISEDKLTPTRTAQFLRFLLTEKENVKEIHNHRFSKLYINVPSAFASAVRTAMKLLPKKLSKRVTVVGKITDLDQYIGDQVPELTDQVIFTWYTEGEELYNETVEKLRL